MPELVTNPYTFTGRRFDPESGLYYYRARYYDAKLGRFLSRDPIGFEGSEWNLYEYVKGMPTRGGDPYGLDGPFGPIKPMKPYKAETGEPDERIKKTCESLRSDPCCKGKTANCEADLQKLFDTAESHTSDAFPSNCQDWAFTFPIRGGSCYDTNGVLYEYPLSGPFSEYRCLKGIA